jgi:hypothetical protein
MHAGTLPHAARHYLASHAPMYQQEPQLHMLRMIASHNPDRCLCSQVDALRPRAWIHTSAELILCFSPSRPVWPCMHAGGAAHRERLHERRDSLRRAAQRGQQGQRAAEVAKARRAAQPRGRQLLLPAACVRAAAAVRRALPGSQDCSDSGAPRDRHLARRAPAAAPVCTPSRGAAAAAAAAPGRT